MYVPTSYLLCVLSLIGCALFGKSTAKRYLYCSEGCCPYEFCAHRKICYPVLRCSVPCPDGTCQNGLCMPTEPCYPDTICPDAFTCAMNFNLGYNTCQYDLDIGKTTCVDRYGCSKADKIDFLREENW